MKQKNFPENIAETILGKKVTEKGASKKELKKQYAAVVRTIMKQLLINLRDLHASGGRFKATHICSWCISHFYMLESKHVI
jgi:hypothetical protein